MPTVQGTDINQFFTATINLLVGQNSEARLINAFVNGLDISSIGGKDPSHMGRPSYSNLALLKLVIYGYRKNVRSSRNLEEICKTNIEAIYLMNCVKPNFRTISDFRKNNIELIQNVFYEFLARINGAVEWGFVSVDGTKLQASNSRENNFTKHKLDDRVRALDGHIEEYSEAISNLDEKEILTKEEVRLKNGIEKRLKDAEKRCARYKIYQKEMEETGATQLSLTDPDSRLMTAKGGCVVAYNPQVAVDSNTHLIKDFQMTNHVTDHGLLSSTVQGIRAEKPNDGILELVADKGYENKQDMVQCLENGVIPHVIPDGEKDNYILEIPYEEGGADPSSTRSEDLKKCLHNGVIPEAYKDVLSDIEVVEVRRKVEQEQPEVVVKSLYKSSEEMIARAQEGYFVRDPENNVVYCPNGESLRQKSIKNNGQIRYANKTACRRCPNRNKCYKGGLGWNEVDFTKDRLEKPCKPWLKAEGKPIEKQSYGPRGQYEKKKIVRFTLTPNKTMTAQRKNLSEHPFGTIKRAMGADYLLLRGMAKATAEFALFCLGYNLVRASNLLGFDNLMSLLS